MARCQLNRGRVHTWHGTTCLQIGGQTIFSQQSTQLGFDRGLHVWPLRAFDRQAVQNQSLNMEMDIRSCVLHRTLPHARKSASLIGFSNLRISVRAAANTIGMFTAALACAAVKAALNAML